MSWLDAAGASIFGLSIGQFIICSCGALSMSTEYGARTIHATFTAVPQRSRVVAAKAIVITIAAFGWGLLVVLTS